jgi:hypothetical protein
MGSRPRFPQPAGGGGDGGGGDIPLPAVRVEGESVSILQDGKPEASLSGIDLHSTGGAGAHTLTGSITDSVWGRWAIKGAVDASLAAEFLVLDRLFPRSLFHRSDRPITVGQPGADPGLSVQSPGPRGLAAGAQARPGWLSYQAEARVEDGAATITPAAALRGPALRRG